MQFRTALAQHVLEHARRLARDVLEDEDSHAAIVRMRRASGHNAPVRFAALAVAALFLGTLTSSVRAVTPTTFHSSIRPLSADQRSLLAVRAWRPGCPVQRRDLRLLTLTHVGFDGRPHVGQLVVNRDVAKPLVSVFRQLYALRFPIRHMRLHDFYVGQAAYPKDLDITASFECRQSVPSPCTGGSRSGHWSNHAYGHAIDLNPRENPYVGCGMTRDPNGRAYLDRSRLRKGMVTPEVVRAFASVGWGWGGSWSGSTKDYMHFSTNGH